MNRLLYISEQLARVYENRSVLNRDIADLQDRISNREAALIPEGGKWSGGNDTERKNNTMKVYADDQILIGLRAQFLSKSASMVDEENRSKTLHAERDSIELIIRDNMVKILGGSSYEDTITQHMLERAADMNFHEVPDTAPDRENWDPDIASMNDLVTRLEKITGEVVRLSEVQDMESVPVVAGVDQGSPNGDRSEIMYANLSPMGEVTIVESISVPPGTVALIGADGTISVAKNIQEESQDETHDEPAF